MHSDGQWMYVEYKWFNAKIFILILSMCCSWMCRYFSEKLFLYITLQAQLLEAKKQLATQNVLHQKTRDLLRSSEQQVAALKAQLASTSTSDAANNTSTPVATRAAALRAPLRGKWLLNWRILSWLWSLFLIQNNFTQMIFFFTLRTPSSSTSLLPTVHPGLQSVRAGTSGG